MRGSASLKAASAAQPVRPGLCVARNSRSLSTVREFFAAKLRNPAKRHANICASGPLSKTGHAASQKAAQKLVRQL